MSTEHSAPLRGLIERAKSREALGSDTPEGPWAHDAMAEGNAIYANRNERLGIDFTVARLAYPSSQVLDPRVLRIAPSATNELHKHAHETVFVILKGEGEVRIGDHWSPVRQGHVAFVPRWIFHQTRNTSQTEDLVIIAITDFGMTSALLGDYDRRTRRATGGVDTRSE
jgi:mannose-6-phosphate isomerase-like protein (cupin superfamily)